MRIKRTERRIAPGGCTQWFAENADKWKELKAGKEIEIPEEEYESIKKKFGLSIEVVKEQPVKKFTKIEKPEKIVTKEGE